MSRPWPLVRFDEILERVERRFMIDDGHPYRCVGVRWYGQGAFVRQHLVGAEIARKEQWTIEPGDVVYNKLFAWKGAFAVADETINGCIVSDKFPTYRADSRRVDLGWLRWYFRTPDIARQAQDLSKGAAAISKLTLNPPDFWKLTIPLPSLAEQRRIVARIEELTAKIEGAQALRQQSGMEAHNLLGARIKSIFTDQAAMSWRHGFLEDYVIDDCYGTSEKTTDDPTGTPIFRMGNIQEGCLEARNLKYLHIRENERPKLVLEKGDILVNRTNSAELVGKCAVFDLDGEYGFASYLIRLRLDQNRADPWLVARYINSPIGREYMFRERKQMTGQANVNSKKLKGLPIRLPPIEEQHRITSDLDDLERQVGTIRRLQAETTVELDALLPSILDKAFNGQL